MKRKILSLILTGVLVVGALTGCGSGSSSETANTSNPTDSGSRAETVQVGTMGTYSPYSFEDESGKLTGYDLEVLRKVEEVDPSLHFEFVAGAWESLFVGLDADKFQMLANQITSNEERQEKYYLTENTYYNCVAQLIVKKGRTDINSLEDLKGKKIGLTVGDSFTLLVEKWNEEHDNILTIEYYSEDITTILQDIANGRVDATVNDPAVAVDKAETQGLEVQPAGERLSSDPTYFIFKKDEKGKELRDKVDAALAKLIADGELSKLSKEWFGADYTS